ncbi:PA14 domain-containing protein [Streptomyces sp. NPDC002896]|uniref:fibronectin type III domain-containing protein n=1 Tax=Streptomyces sp. NPDC002896 TaxID=3154438 RepID=UPI00331D13B1
MTTRARTTAVTSAVVLATAGGLLASVPASAAVTCASPVYKRQFYANTTFSGTPKKTDCDSKIDQNWGTGAPASGLPSNNFGVRWTVTRDFGSGGPFAFPVESRDGIRVYLDGTRKVDLWKNVSTTQKKTVNVTIPSGKHTLRIDFVNWTGAANVKFGYAPRTSADVDKVKPLAPTGAAVTYDAATGRAKLSWAKNKEMDLAGYRVYRRLKGSSDWARLTTTTATSYTDIPPQTGGTYYYEVRAYDKAGNESAGTADQGVTTPDKTPPAAPFVQMDVCADDEKVAGPELVTTVANQADIALYEAQRKDPGTGAWTTVYTGTKGGFCDRGQPADGTEATYRGRARDAAGNWSVYSAATTLKLEDRIAPAVPADAHAGYRSGVPHLVWTADADVAKYEVLQHDPATGAWLKAFGDSATTAQTDVVPLQQVKVADEYRYAVRAVDAHGNASAPVEIALNMAERTEAISPYQLSASVAWTPGVSLNWSSTDPWTVDLGHLPTFEIVRTDTATGESTTIEQCWPQDGEGPLQPPTNSTSSGGGKFDPAYVAWDDTVVNTNCLEGSGASETTYEYRIVAIDRYGHRSQPSEPATATTTDTEFPGPVGDLKAEVIPLGVRLTWNPPADEDVTGYTVWQSATDPGTGETVWERNCWTSTNMPETEILCPTLPDGREHLYRVAASGGEYSDGDPEDYHFTEVSVTLPDTRPPGWTGTTITEDQYPELYVRCGVTIYDRPCGDYTDYRWERWDPASASWTLFATGKVADPDFHLDETVHEDRLGLYYYRAVYSDPAGNEEVVEQEAYGIWDDWL